jgi:cysteine-rich repeat protein
MKASMRRYRAIGALLAVLPGMGAAGCASDPSGVDDTADGTGTGETESSDDATSGEDGSDPLCGNGELDPDEECDDGNSVDFDGCNDECMVSGSLRWEYGHAVVDDEAEGEGIAVSQSGRVFLAGHERASSSADIWVHALEDDGSEAWNAPYLFDPPGTDLARDCTVLSDGSLLVVGQTTGGSAWDMWFHRFNPDGSEAWDAPIAPGTPKGLAFSVAPTEGGFVVAGTTDEFDAVNVWLREFDFDGEPLWAQPRVVGNSNRQRASSVAVSSAGDIVVVGATEEDTSWDVFLDAYASDGTPLWNEPWIFDVDEHSDEGHAASFVPDGGFVLAAVTSNGSNSDFWFGRYAIDQTPEWDAPVIDDRGAYEDPADIATFDDGSFIVVGHRNDLTHDIWINRRGPDGTPSWPEPVVIDYSDVDTAAAVAIGPERNVYVIGSIGEHDFREIWVGSFVR